MKSLPDEAPGVILATGRFIRGGATMPRCVLPCTPCPLPKTPTADGGCATRLCYTAVPCDGDVAGGLLGRASDAAGEGGTQRVGCDLSHRSQEEAPGLAVR